jgi:sulfur carrier protein ThiS
VTVMVEGRSRSLPAGLTVAQVLERLELPAMGGDLLAVDHSVLRKNAYPPRVLVNGQPARATRPCTVATESRWPAARAGLSP